MSTPVERNLEVFLDTNNKCNLRCVTCAFSDPRVAELKMNTMPQEMFSKICADILPRASYATLSCLTEPLMTRSFARYLAEAGQCGVPQLEFVSNGLLMRDEHLEACVAARLWRLTISVDGVDAPTYEAIRRGGRFNRLEDSIRRVGQVFATASHRPRLRIIMTLIRENFMSVATAARQFIDWGASEIELRETVTFPNIGLAERQLGDQRTALRRELDAAIAIAEDSGVPIEVVSENAPELGLNLSNIPSCHALERRVAIAANGDVMPCMLWAREPLGNLHLSSFDEIWNGSRRAALRDEFRRTEPAMWCHTCTACKDDPKDDDAFFRLLAKTTPF